MDRIHRIVKIEPKSASQKYSSLADDLVFDASSVSVNSTTNGVPLNFKCRRLNSVYDGTVTTLETIANQHLLPLVHELVNGINGYFLTMGTHGPTTSSNSTQSQGPQGSNKQQYGGHGYGSNNQQEKNQGFFPLAIRAVFSALEKKYSGRNVNDGISMGQKSNPWGGPQSQKQQSKPYVVRLSFFEVCEEQIRDLFEFPETVSGGNAATGGGGGGAAGPSGMKNMNNNNNDANMNAAGGVSGVTGTSNNMLKKGTKNVILRLADTVEYGVVVEGCACPKAESNAEALQMLGEANARRYNTSPSLIRKLTTVLKIEVLQERQVYSSLTIIEVPSIQVLAETRQTVQLKEGHDAFRGVFALQDILLNRKKDNVGETNQSTLTWLLRDVLFGQNAVCTFLLHIRQNEPGLSVKGLQLLEAAENVALAPVKFETSISNLQQALRREVLMIRRTLQSRAAMGNGAIAVKTASTGAVGTGGTGSAFMSTQLDEATRRVQSLEGEMLQLETKLTQTTNDQRKCQAQLLALQDKYDKVVLSVMALKKERLQKEDEKLKIARALVSLQKKYARLQRDYEDKKYSDTKKLVSFEQEVIQLSMDAKKRGQQKEILDHQLAERRQQQEDIEEKLENAQKTLALLKLEKAKGDGANEELSVEVVNLMNQKSDAEKRYSQLSVRYTDLKTQFENFQAAHGAEQDTMESYRERIGSLKTQLENEQKRSFEKGEKADLLDKQLKESMKKQLSLEEETMSNSESTNRFRRELEEERQLRISKEIEISKLKQEFEHVKVGMEKGFLALTKQLNPSDVFKQAGDANAWEINRLRATVADLEEKLNQARTQGNGPGGGGSPTAQRRREELLHQEIKRLREELKSSNNKTDTNLNADRSGSGGNNNSDQLSPSAAKNLRNECERLQSLVNELESKNRQLELQAGRPDGDEGDESVMFLQQKCQFLENTITEMERERANLLIRATSAEEQLREVQIQMQDLIQDYERKLKDAKR